MISFHRVDALRESSPNDRRTRLDRIPRSHSSSPSRASIPSHLDFRLARVRIARAVRARRPIRARRIRAPPPSPSSIERDDRPTDRPNASRSRLASRREDESTSPERARTIRARSIDASRRARARGRDGAPPVRFFVCVYFFFARVVIVFCLIDGVVFVYVEWRARAGPSRRCARGRDGTARPRDDLNGMEWDEMRCDCRVRARTGVSDGRDANGGIETRSIDRSTTRARERDAWTRDRTRVSFAPPRASSSSIRGVRLRFERRWRTDAEDDSGTETGDGRRG